MTATATEQDYNKAEAICQSPEKMKSLSRHEVTALWQVIVSYALQEEIPELYLTTVRRIAV